MDASTHPSPRGPEPPLPPHVETLDSDFLCEVGLSDVTFVEGEGDVKTSLLHGAKRHLEQHPEDQATTDPKFEYAVGTVWQFQRWFVH
mmetsp:Transcript_35320/g.59859  ORF Transcript_35320/g.59859 Transcript_35320/m.59859 type:complete len:88 (+) Transcript_35320:2-265(+)